MESVRRKEDKDASVWNTALLGASCIGERMKAEIIVLSTLGSEGDWTALAQHMSGMWVRFPPVPLEKEKDNDVEPYDDVEPKIVIHNGYGHDLRRTPLAVVASFDSWY